MADVPILGGPPTPSQSKRTGEAGGAQHARERALHSGHNTRVCYLCGLPFGLKGMSPAVKAGTVKQDGHEWVLYKHKDWCPIVRP